MKKFTFLLLGLIMMTNASAYDFMVDGLAYSINSGDSTVTVTYTAYYSTTNYSGLTTADIPNSVIYNGTAYSVTTIGDYAFCGSTDLTSVTIPNSVTSIGQSAFEACSGLTSMIVDSENKMYDSRYNCNAIIETATNTLIFGCKNTVIPNSVTSIGNGAFAFCRFTSVDIPNSVTSIGDNAFYSCTGLTSVIIPNSVTSIGKGVFYYCTGLTTVTIPNSVITIGDYAFIYCSGLTSVTIPNSVTSIGKSAFESCSGLTSMIVDSENAMYDSRYNCNAIIETATNTLLFGCKNTVIPNSVTSIGSRAFYECRDLTSVTIPNSVTSIGKSAFEDCTGLTSMTMGNSLISIGKTAFYRCSGLTKLTIPNSVTTIGEYAFFYCTGLTSMTIGNSVASIGEYAFFKCVGLKSIYSKIKDINISYGNYIFDGVLTSTCVLYVLKGCLSDYQSTLPWSVFTNIVEENEGDVDGDGVVTSSDVTCLYNYLLNGDSNDIVNGDQDGDGFVTSADITVIYNILLGE